MEISIPLSSNRNSIVIPVEFTVTGNPNHSESFLLWDSGPTSIDDRRILMFSTPRNIQFLSNCTGLLIDGTFKTAPSLFKQVYTIQGTRLEGPEQQPGKAIPLIFCLLPDKQERTYMDVFETVKRNLPGWEPTRVMLDFERAAINAVQTQWINTQITGCFFHLRQSLHRQIKEYGLARFHSVSTENTVRFNMIAALAFVPPDDVIEPRGVP